MVYLEKKIWDKRNSKIEKLLSKTNIKFIDTAHQYKNSEEIIGKSKLKKLNIVTKIKLPKQRSSNIKIIVKKIVLNL